MFPHKYACVYEHDTKNFVVDTSTPSLLGNLAKEIKKPIIIDHHAKTSWENAELYYHDEKNSCAEIIYEIIKKTNFKINKKVGLAYQRSRNQWCR